MEDTRKTLLEEQFDAVQEVAPAEVTAEPTIEATDRPRDDAGRFAAKAPEPAEPPPAEEPVWSKPPASWKKEYHEHWFKADPKIREYAWQREEQMRKGVEPLISKAQFADAMNAALEPYLPTIRGLGLSPDKAVAALAQADHTLRTSPPEQRLQYFMQLAQQYGINLQGQALPANQPANQQTIDPTVYALQNELNMVRGEVMGWKQQQEMAENQKLLDEINTFSTKAEHFEEVRPTMIQLLQSGMAQTLDEAYTKAIRFNDDLFEKVQSSRQAEIAANKSSELNKAAKAARAAAVSVRSATPGANTAPKAQSRRALLEEAFDEMGARL
jgi:hypothetical protein